MKVFLFVALCLISITAWSIKVTHISSEPFEILLYGKRVLVSSDRKFALPVNEIHDEEKLFQELYQKIAPKVKLPPFEEFRSFLIRQRDQHGFILRFEFQLEKFYRTFPHISLNISNVHTFCDIQCNGKKIGRTENAFRTYSFPIKHALKKFNKLEFIFQPTKKVAAKLAAKYPFSFPADNQGDSIKTAPFIRQSQQEFGWDFCQPHVYTGLLSIPVLKFEKQLRFIHYHFENQYYAKDTFQCDVVVTLESDFSDSIEVELTDRLFPPTGGKKKVFIQKGTHHYTFPLLIENPQYWAPKNSALHNEYIKNGMFMPMPYEENILFQYKDPEITLNIPIKISPRKTELIQQNDSIGFVFTFRINNEAVFAKGLNIIAPLQKSPQNHDIASPLLDDILLNSITNSDINMVRIWGGGIYLPESFYDWADENGIMIWQDFMFSGTMYPYDSSFLQNVNEEVKEQVFRLSKHPSIVLFCGNNELEVAWKNWGWQKKYNYTEQQQQEIWKGYQTLFHEMIPKNIQNIAPEIPYIPSSPISNWGKPEDFDSGDNHDWRVWHGEMHPDVFYTHIPRFASEFGAPSLPSVTVLEEYFQKQVSEIRENELQALVYSYKGWRLLKKYIEQEYGTINSTEAWIYFSQHFQAEAMQKAIESHRFNPARCGGSLVWQLNDIDPVISWSLFDKNNIAKQAWYSVQKNFASSLLYFKNTTDSIQLWYAAKEGSEEEIRIRFMHRDGIVYSDQKQKVRSNANPICIAQFAKNDLHSKGNLDEIFLVAQLPQQAYQSPRTKIQLFVPFQKFRWKKQDIEIIPTENQNHFVLKSSSLQGSVYMPLPKNLHPNYTPYVLNRFDLIPGDSLIMELPLPQGISISEFTKTWKSLNYFYSTKM